MKSKISTHTCEDCFAVLHKYRKPNLVVYGKILYVVKIKVDFSYTIKNVPNRNVENDKIKVTKKGKIKTTKIGYFFDCKK